ncbi:MAG: hypothetical protein ACR2JY_22250 [Chloroflexota bacterium]
MAELVRTFEGKIYLAVVVGSILCELLGIPLFLALGLSSAQALALDILVTQVALIALGALLLWICALLLRRDFAAAGIALLFSIGVELFFFGNLGVTPNLWLTGFCVIGVGICTWWAVRHDRRLAVQPRIAPSAA